MVTKEQFIIWAQTLGLMALQNEAEVETKFIIPLFQHLGYPDECRRDKYPLRSYNPGKHGRKPEIDLIYFSVGSPNEQDSDTSLVIVEAKEPGRNRDGLVEDLKQARFYSYELKAPILVVTNGRELIAVREHPHRAAKVFDGSLESLKSGENAAAFFERLNFQAVKEVKEASFVEQTVLHFDDFSPPVPIHFCGRDEELSKLKAEIKQNSIIVIGGIAGIGKSYLAAQLAQELREAFPVIWLSFGPQTSLEQFLGGLAHYMRGTFGDPTLLNAIQTQNTTEELRIKLAGKQLDKYGCLLIWDNFNQSINKSFLTFLTACGHQLERGRLLITTKEWITLEGLFNAPAYMPALTSLDEKAGIELLQRLGTGESQVSTLKKAHERIGGHPQLLTLLAGLSKLFPLTALLEDLPHVPDKVNQYIQQRVLDTLEPDAKQMLYGLSLLEIPFQLSVVNHLSRKADRYHLFDKVLNRFLVTRLGQQSDRYDIHELVKAFCRRQLPVESLPSFHASLYAYCKDLPAWTYVEGRMLVYHALNGGLIEEGYVALKQLLSAALYQGMYDFILEYTSTVLKDERVKSWGFVHFARGRVLRVKERYLESREAYDAALRHGKDIDETEMAKYELASVLTYLSETSEEIDIKQAREYYTGLLHSSNIEMQLRAAIALGTLSLRNRSEECIPELEAALSLAEQVGSTVNIFQVCISLGQAYIDIRKDDEQAKCYLERSLKMQVEHAEQLGANLTLSLYITHLELAKLYERVGRFGEARDSWKACVEINRGRDVPDLLAESLNRLGRVQLRTGDSKHAKGSFLESTELINKYELQGDILSQHLEWLTVALWESGDYERALEYSMELAYLSEESQGLSPLAIVSAFDAPARSEILRLRDKGFFMLVLPSMFNPDVINDLARKIKQRQPKFAGLSLMPLQKVSQPTSLSRSPVERKVGRNEPCPCGSKRKFKKCCGASSAN